MSLISSYDNEWTISITNSNASTNTLENTKGAFIGNGKIGFISAFDKIGVQKSLITIDFDFNDYGSYQNNIVEGFDSTTLKVFDNKYIDSVSSIRFKSKELQMYNGILTSSFQVINTTTSNTLDINFDLYSVRHLPYCSVQTFNITPTQSMSNFDVYHQISCGNNISQVEYNNNIIYNELVHSSKGLYMCNGKGIIKGTEKQLAIATCYYFENSNNIHPIGFNVYAKDTNTCFQKIHFNDLTAGSNYKFHIISAQMSEYDFKNPMEETKRILVNVMNKLDNDVAISKLRQTHIKSWSDMWKHNITIEPKTNITSQDLNNITQIKRLMRYNLYNIWSAVREGIKTEINPSTLSIIDTNGTLFWDGDLWFIPVITLFRPDIAKNLLESRYRVIDKAIQLAAGYGYKGSKFPYVNDIVGYGNNPYWDVNGPLHIFNTALVSINVWNYYRISLDKDWLQNKGYTILKNNANFFVSKIEIDINGTYHIREVYSFHDKVSDNNSLTNYLIKTALKYAIEASYELAIIPVESWSASYFNIEPSMYPSSNSDPNYDINLVDVFKLDEDTVVSDEFKILEQMIPILPFYSELFFRTNVSRDRNTIQRNLVAVQNKIQNGFETWPMNNIILTWLKGSLMCCDPMTLSYENTYPGLFELGLAKIIQENSKGIWGQFHMSNREDTDYNDLSLSAMFILMLLTSVGTLRVTGNVSETRFYGESFGIRSSPTSYMPKSWKKVKITGLGSGPETLQITNELYYN